MNRFRAASSLSLAVLGLLIAPGTPAFAQDRGGLKLPEYVEGIGTSRRGDGDSDRVRLEEARREIQVLEARIAIRKAEIEEILARGRRKKAEEALAALVDGGEERARLTRADVERSSVPFPDTVKLPSDAESRIRKAITDAVETKDRPLLEALDRKIVMAFPDKTPLEDVLKYFRTATRGDKLPNGVPIIVDPAGIDDVDGRMRTKVSMVSDQVALSEALTFVLKQAKLAWTVKDGLLVISAEKRSESK